METAMISIFHATPIAHALDEVVIAAERQCIITPADSTELRRQRRAVAAMESCPSTCPDWLEMAAKGAKHYKWDLADHLESKATNQPTQWRPAESLGNPMVRRAISAAAAETPPPFPWSEPPTDPVGAYVVDLQPRRHRVPPPSPAVDSCALSPDLAA